MSGILHVVASPRGSDSASRSVAKVLIDEIVSVHEKQIDVDTLDLYTEELPPYEAPAAAGKYAIMGGKSPVGESETAWAEIIKVIDRLKSAKALVISSPMWNFSIPYKLKHFIDVVVQPGLTFSFSPEAGYKGLVTGRPAVLVLARGGDYSSPPASDFDMQEPYLRGVLQFMGYTDIQTITIEPTLHGGPEVAAQKLESAIEKAVKIAEITCL